MPRNRWLILGAGTALQMCLGTAYAWSYWQQLLGAAYGWSNTRIAWAFSLSICFLGLAAAWGGLRLQRWGARRLAMTGGVLFAVGYLITAYALAIASPLLVLLGYGVVGGIGLGLGYVTPVATAAAWFPERKGLATGLVIMGFGLGALVMAKVAAPLLFALGGGTEALVYVTVDGHRVLSHPEAVQAVLVRVFAWLGVGFLVITVPLGSLLRQPPAPAAAVVPQVGEALAAIASRRFALMWLVFFCNITAGIAIIGFQSPLFQQLWLRRDPGLEAATLAGYGATLIGVTALFNGFGRSLWGACSDRIGRIAAFRLMLGVQVLAFAALAATGNPWLFAGLLCVVLLCYGGGFGTMPAFVGDVFGPRLMPVVYGAILTAWSAAGIVGPQLAAQIADRVPQQAAQLTFLAGAACTLVGCLATLALRRPAASC